MRSLASELIAEIGPRLGLEVHIEPTYRYVGQLVSPDGRKFYFRNTHFDLNPQGAAETARDKHYAAYFLRRLGYPVPEGETFFSDSWCRVVDSPRDVHAAYSYARRIGFPIVVKPNSKSHGSGVSRVHDKREFYRAMRAVFTTSEDHIALVQRFVHGSDYRIVVLDGEVVAAYRRMPLSVVGDGRSSLRELLQRALDRLAAEGRSATVSEDDARIRACLERQRLSLGSIPPDGQSVVLLDNANLSSGGQAQDVTDLLHADYRHLAVRITRDMGLRYCGVDLIVDGPIDQPPLRYVVVEINAAPGLDHFAHCGERQRQVVEAMYERILRAITGV